MVPVWAFHRILSHLAYIAKLLIFRHYFSLTELPFNELLDDMTEG